METCLRLNLRAIMFRPRVKYASRPVVCGLAKVTTMKPVRLILLGAAVGFASQAALAFQETTTGKAGEQPAAAAEAPAVGLSTTLPSIPKAQGQEIRLPGLGAIGTLPRLDFGLELLYGVNEQKGVREEPLKRDDSDMQIRGTVKYRFNNN